MCIVTAIVWFRCLKSCASREEKAHDSDRYLCFVLPAYRALYRHLDPYATAWCKTCTKSTPITAIHRHVQFVRRHRRKLTCGHHDNTSFSHPTAVTREQSDQEVCRLHISIRQSGLPLFTDLPSLHN